MAGSVAPRVGTVDPAFAKGKLTKVTSSVSETRYTQFDNLGRLLQMEQRTPVTGETFTTLTPKVSRYQYNFAGALIQETYPSNRIVNNDFNANGDLSRIYGKATSTSTERTYANSFTYTADGKIEKLKLGNGLTEWAKFNNRLQVTELALGRGVTNASVWDLKYDYGELQSTGVDVDANKNTGNIAKQTLNFAGLTNPLIQTYKYDSLYRLTEARETGNNTQNWIQTFGYDRFGNRISLSQNVGGLTNNQTPTVDPNKNRFVTGQGFTYDKNGNIIQDKDDNGAVRTYVFDGNNKQRFVAKAGSNLAEYSYDGEGKRVKKIVYESNGTTVKEETVFVYSSGKLVEEYSTKQPPTNPTTSYTVTDQLLSPRVITDSVGNVVSRRDFMPFGEEITNNIGERQASNLKYGAEDNVRQKFTGYQKDDETSLDFAEARMYEERHGRFTAVDPLLASGKSANPQSFNRYTYVMNNPLILTYPVGLQAGFWAYHDVGGTTGFRHFSSQTEMEAWNNKSQGTALCKNNPACSPYQVWTRGQYIIGGDRDNNYILRDNGTTSRFTLSSPWTSDDEWNELSAAFSSGTAFTEKQLSLLNYANSAQDDLAQSDRELRFHLENFTQAAPALFPLATESKYFAAASQARSEISMFRTPIVVTGEGLIHRDELIFTDDFTKRVWKDFGADAYENGIKESIKYAVGNNGQKFIVTGNNRLG